MFSCEFCEISKNTFLHRTSLVATSGVNSSVTHSVALTYLEIFRGYRLYLKSLVLVSRKVPSPILGTEGPKIFEFNTSKLLKKVLNALPSHFKFEQAFVFRLLFFLPQSLGADTASAVSYSRWIRLCVVICISKFKDHPNIKLIRENVSVVNLFTFPEINESDIEREILKFNLEKAGKSRSIPTKVQKVSSDMKAGNFEKLQK